MREIKFRAWSPGVKADSVATRKKFGEWVFPPQMLFDEKPGDCLVWKSQGQNIEIMQYTGLLDRNETEIYEGDLLKISIIGYSTGKVIAEQTSPVEYRHCKFGVPWSDVFTGLDGFSNTTFEVVGNIHQAQEWPCTCGDCDGDHHGFAKGMPKSTEI